jgi:DNA polymerase-3 subunit beta
MKLAADREALLAAFQTAAMVAPARSPKTILQNVKLLASKDATLLLATDLEVGVRCKVPNVTVDKPGACVLPSQRVNSILRALADEQVNIETDGQQTIVHGASSRFQLAAEDPDQFPEVPDFDDQEKLHVVPARMMREMIRRTVLATDVENTRYALSGVLVELTDKKMIMVGTDGRRLAYMEGEAHGQGGHKTDENPHVVPTKAMKLIERTLQDDNTEVALHVRANEVLLRSERATIYSRLVEGRFPRYQDVIPRKTKIKVEFLADPLLRAVRQAAIVTSEESRGVEFSFKEGQLSLAAKAPDVGQSEVELPITYDGPETQISFDPRYVCDFLSVLDPETPVTVELIDADSAALWKTSDGYSYVVMPLTREH